MRRAKAVHGLAALVMAGAGVAGLAARAMALSGDAASPASALTVALEPSPGPASAPTPAFPPITTEQLADASPGPAPSGTAVVGQGGSVEQVLVLSISGGSMSVSPASTTVVLQQVKRGTYSGTFGPITVTDARGTQVGWSLKVTGPDVGGELTAIPGPAVAVTGRSGEALARPSSRLDSDGTQLMVAPAGGGGGQFSIGGTVELNVRDDTGGAPLVIPVTLGFRVS